MVRKINANISYFYANLHWAKKFQDQLESEKGFAENNRAQDHNCPYRKNNLFPLVIKELMNIYFIYHQQSTPGCVARRQ
jgi:hypothetical protein